MKKIFFFVLTLIATLASAAGEYPITNQITPPSTPIGVANLCSTPVWIEYTGPDHTLQSQTYHIVKIDPLYQFDYPVSPQTGTSSLRFTPKFYCDNNGKNCNMGEQSQTANFPSINTLFEATIESSTTISPPAQYATYDLSLVDGFTIPAVVKVFQGEDEINGSCTNIDDGNLPMPPFMLNPKSDTYASDVQNFTNICKSSFADGSYNSFITYNVSNNPDNTYSMPWFAAPVPLNSTSTLAQFTPIIINPHPNLAQGGNPNNNMIACASPSGRFTSVNNTQTQYLQDGQGVLHPNHWSSDKGYAYDADILNVNCPYSELDVKNMIDSNYTDTTYLSPYDASKGVAATNSPFAQLIRLYLNNPNFKFTDASGKVGYHAALLCKYGPAATSYWTQTIHNITTYTYSYPYDDNSGTRGCYSKNSKLVFVTCGKLN